MMNDNGARKERLKILLVDDEAFVHDLLKLLIDQQAYSVISATNVREAMELVAKQKPDIIITDGLMPGESGFCLIEQVKSDPSTETIPIVLLTILQRPNGAAMDASGKADFCVNKPIYLSDISSALELARELIERRKINLAQAFDIANVHLPEPDKDITVRLAVPAPAIEFVI
jgi:CheY-like chemotaxis protein